MNRLTPYLPGIIITVGIILRFREYFAQRSLWIDEAALALNLINKSYLALLGPLDNDQFGPIIFLWAGHLSSQIFGRSELALRLFPFICSIIALLLFYKLALLLFSKKYAMLALTLFALSNDLIYYSSEVKQYSVDVMVAIILYLFLIPLYEKKKLKNWEIISLTFIGPISILFSQPAIFILAGFSIMLFFKSIKNRERVLSTASVLVAWFLSIYGYYLIFVKYVYGRDYYIIQWPFLELFPSSPSDLYGNFSRFFSIFTGLMGYWSATPGLLVFLIGIFVMFKSKAQLLCLLLLPLSIGLVLSGLHKYPFVSRLFLYSAPSIFLITTEGLRHTVGLLQTRPGKFIKIVSISLCLLIFSQPIALSIEYFIHPRTNEEIKPILEYYKAHHKNEDATYLYYSALPAFEFYAPVYDLAGFDYITGKQSRKNWLGYIGDLSRLVGHKRVWIIFSHVLRFTPINKQDRSLSEEEYMTEYLDTVGKKLDSFKGVNASIYLYDLSLKI